MASSSSSQLERWQREFVPDDEMCACVFPRPPKLRVSWTYKNPGRRFVNCARSVIGYDCKYWRWIDPVLTPYYKQTMIYLKYQSENGSLHTRIDRLEEELDIYKECIEKLEEEKSALQIKEEEVESALQLKEEEVQSVLKATHEDYEARIKELQATVKTQRVWICILVLVGIGIWIQAA